MQGIERRDGHVRQASRLADAPSCRQGDGHPNGSAMSLARLPGSSTQAAGDKGDQEEMKINKDAGRLPDQKDTIIMNR